MSLETIGLKKMTKVKFNRLKRDCPAYEKTGNRGVCKANEKDRCSSKNCIFRYWVYAILDYEPANQ